jgi:hypothetical protein
MSLNIPNLDKLIAHLEAQPPERINMGYSFSRFLPTGRTCGCIYVHAEEVGVCADEALNLDMPSRYESQLTQPPGWYAEQECVVRYPAHRVIATLKRLRDRFLATGEIVVDWGAEPTAGESWSTPRAVEITPPALPETLTRLLAAQPAPTTTEA